MESVSIRAFREEDLPRVLDIAEAAWEPIYGMYRKILGEDLFRRMHPDWQREKRDSVADGCEPRPGGYARVAELDGEIVGFVTFYANRYPGVGEIGNNAVDPGYQGCGIASKLYETALETLREAGMEHVCVGTGGDPAHAPARAAYRKVGFKTVVPTVYLYQQLSEE